MGRYLGPRCKLSRREGEDLLLTSGVRPLESKCHKDSKPGMHAGKRVRLTDYGNQLRAKQKLKRIYGLREKQFRRYYENAARRRGSTGENLLHLLEQRLDNLVYRVGFASTRAEARQLVSHKSVLLNGKLVNIASCLVKPGDQIQIREASRKQARVQAAFALSQQRPSIDWVEIDDKNFGATLKYLPALADLPPTYNVNLVVELYSK